MSLRSRDLKSGNCNNYLRPRHIWSRELLRFSGRPGLQQARKVGILCAMKKSTVRLELALVGAIANREQGSALQKKRSDYVGALRVVSDGL